MTAEHEKYIIRSQKVTALIELERYREALSEIGGILANSPGDYFTLCQKAICHLKLKAFQDGYDTTKLAIASDPESEWAYRIQSLIFSANGQHDRALDAAQASVRRMPVGFESNQTLFYAQANYGLLTEAKQTLDTVLLLAPNEKAAHIAKGFLALEEKQHADAERSFLEALKLDPESTNALNNLGVVYLQMANAGKGAKYRQLSLEMFERAVRSQPMFKLGQNNMRVAREKPPADPRGWRRWAGLIGMLFLFSSVPQILLYNLFSDQIDEQTTIGDVFSPFSKHVELTILNFASIVLYPAAIATMIYYQRFVDGTGNEAGLNNARTWRIALYLSGLVSVIYSVLIIINFSEINSFPGIGLRLWLLAAMVSALNFATHRHTAT